MNLNEIPKNYKRDGYVLLKHVFSKNEVQDFRKRIANLKSNQGDVLTHESLREIILDDRVLSALRAILGDKLVYFGDTAIRNESEDGYRSFHRDSQLDFEDPTKTEYPVVRVGLYMQDHVAHSGGLKVRIGSYRHEYIGKQNIRRALFGNPHGKLSFRALRLGKSHNLDIEEGDVAIWNLRTWHSGYAVRLKWFPKLSINPKLEKYIPKSLSLPSTLPRMAIFASFGSPSKNLDTYIKERAEHPSNAELWKHSDFNRPEIVDLCKKKGVELRFDGLKK